MPSNLRCCRCGKTINEGCGVGYWEGVLRGDPEAPRLERVATSRNDALQVLVNADRACRARCANDLRNVEAMSVESFINWCEVTDAAHEVVGGACVECGLVV